MMPAPQSSPHPRQFPDTVAVEVKSLVTVQEFDHYIRPGGKPLVIEGWTGNWRARSAWDFDFFKDRYGGDTLTIPYSAGETEDVLEVSMSEYIDYILDRDPCGRLRQLQDRLRAAIPFYCLSYKPFSAHPELWDDFTMPPFAANWLPFFNEAFTRSHFPQEQGWILISRKGAEAPAHQDSSHTITWLAQLRGSKACYLFSPDDSEALYWGKIDPTRASLDKFPGLKNAKLHYCVLRAGQMLFLPPDWWHHVVALENSITVSCNLVNHLNLGYYLRSAYGARLPEVLALLPPAGARAGGATPAGTQYPGVDPG